MGLLVIKLQILSDTKFKSYFLLLLEESFVHKGRRQVVALTSGSLFDPRFSLCKGHLTLLTVTVVDISQPLTYSGRSASAGPHEVSPVGLGAGLGAQVWSHSR